MQQPQREPTRKKKHQNQSNTMAMAQQDQEPLKKGNIDVVVVVVQNEMNSKKRGKKAQKMITKS